MKMTDDANVPDLGQGLSDDDRALVAEALLDCAKKMKREGDHGKADRLMAMSLTVWPRITVSRREV
jgi:hypothetical protein